MATTSADAAQNFVPIEQIRDGVVILKDGGMRLVLIASSINFALKSYDEQVAILAQYQTFLNSLDFPIQIFIQSRALDIRPYIQILDQCLKEQTAELLKIQVKEYIQFIKEFVDTTDIMTKAFFIVVPYDPPVFSTGGSAGKSFWPFGKKESNATRELKSFQESRTQLEQRANVISQGLNGIGIRVKELGTEELVELYFKQFNPGESDVPTISG